MTRGRLNIGDAPPRDAASRSVPFRGEPPLDLLGPDATRIDRREVNLRWLVASVLTGFAGTGLVGAALHVSLQGAVSFAAVPERAAVLVRSDPTDPGIEAARKGDRLVRNPMVASAKQVFRTPVTVRLGDREIIKVRPFVRLTTALPATVGVYAGEIPRFDPMRFLSDEPAERAPEPSATEGPGAEVTVVKRDLLEVGIEPGAPALGDDEVAAQIEEERRLTAEAGRRATIPLAPQILLSRTLQHGSGLAALDAGKPQDASPFKSIEVLVVPENVTRMSKSETALVEERDLALKRGESLDAALRAAAAIGEEQVRGVIAALGGRARIAALPEGQQFRVQIAPAARPGEGRQITRVTLYGENGVEGIAAANDRGSFVSVSLPAEEAAAKAKAPVAAEAAEDEDDESFGPRLYQSLYEAAARHDLPRASVEDIVRIFSYDLDFQRRISVNDGIDLLYTYDEDAGQNAAERPDILYAALNIGGESRKVYRFQSPDDGSIDYFDDQGRSLKKFLIRKPIADGIMRSGFGYRRHPILGYAKLHTGVDWANPVGTPIVAAGNGTVIKAEWDSGYGRRVEIQHINGYVTTYNHMSRFGRGISAGNRVRQGQVIGYVGSTGLSTGAHLHYEVVINGHFVDPMKIRVPRGKELDGRMLAEFKRQREQVDAVLQKSRGVTATAQKEVAVR